jgi:autotransporter-associated beta strand protein
MGSGITTLAGSNVYTGVTTINGGILRPAIVNALPANSAVTLTNGAGVILDLNNFNQTIGSLAGGGSMGGNITLGSAILTVGGDNTSTIYGGVVSGGGGLTKTGAGITTLVGANTYSGPTTINAGTIRAGIVNALPSHSAVILTDGAGVALELNNFNQTIGSLAGGGTTGGNAALGSATLTVGGDNTSTTYAGVVSGSGGLTKTGTGITTLAGANTYSGLTTVNAGTLAIEVGGSIAQSSAVNLSASGASLDLASAGNQIIKDLTGVNGTTLVLGITASNVLTVGTSNSTTFAGIASGNGGLAKQGSGTLTVSGNNTYTGETTVNAGTFNLTGSLIATARVTVNAGGTFDLSNNAVAQTIGDLGGTGGEVKLSRHGLTLGTLNDITYAGILSGNGGITKQGAGKLILHAVNIYTGITTLTEGTLAIGAGGSLATSSLINLSTAGTVFDLSAAGSQTIKDLSGVSGTSLLLGTMATDILTLGTSNTITFAGNASGNGGLTKQGTGILNLTGTNTYTGDTTVARGELKVNGSIANSSVTVNNGGRLSGIGTVGPLMTVGTVAPGNSIGKLVVNGNYTQPGTYECEIDNNGNTDQIEINGQADLAGGTLKVIPLAGSYSDGFSRTYTILMATGGLGNTSFANVEGVSPLFTYLATYDNNNAFITITKTLSVSEAIPLGNPGKVATYLNSYAPPSLEDKLNALDETQLTKAFNDLSPAANTQISDMISNAELGAMDNIFAAAEKERLSTKFDQLQAHLASNLASFKQSFNQLFASKLQSRTTAFAIARNTDPKHLPISVRVAWGKATVWMQGAAGRFSQNNIADPSGLAVQGLKGSTYNTNMGIDYAFTSTFRGGITAGYGYHQYKMNINGDKGSTNSSRIGLYGLWEPIVEWHINGAAYYGHHCFKGDRIMTVIPAVAHQKHRGNHLSGLIELGRDTTWSESLTVTPYLSGGALSLQEKKYRETGANVQNLRVKGRNSTTAQGKTGIQVSKLWKGDDFITVYSFARLGVIYRRALNRNQKVYAALVDQGGQFTVFSRNRRRVLANPSMGITIFINNDVGIGLTYDGEIGSAHRNHQAMIQVKWRG